MGKFCRFCGSKFGRVISLNVKTIDEGRYELQWCTECGKIQNDYR